MKFTPSKSLHTSVHNRTIISVYAQHAMYLFLLHSFNPHHDKFSLSPHAVFSCGCWDWCELQGQKLRSVPDWICRRRESFGVAPEISPSHSLPLSLSLSLSTQNNIQHSGIPNITNVKSLDVFLFSISACLLFSWSFGSTDFCVSKCSMLNWSNSHLCKHKLNLSNLGVRTSRNDFVKTGAHLSGKKKINQRNSKRNLVS